MNDRRSHLDRAAIFWLVLCSALWGVNQVVAKVALDDIPPLTQAAARSLGAALLVALWAYARRLPTLGRQPWRDPTWRAGLFAGSLFAAEFACIFIGLQFTTASRMGVFIYIAPFVVALGMPWLRQGESLNLVQVLGLSGAFAAVAWTLAEGFTADPGLPHQWLGDLLGLAGGLLWGGTTLAIRASALSHARAETTLLYQLAVSGVLLAAAAWGFGESWPTQISTLSLALLAFQIVIICFASYLLWFWLVRHYPAAQISSFTLLTPMFGVLAGAWLLNEAISTRLWFALVAVCIGLLLVARGGRGRRAQAP